MGGELPSIGRRGSTWPAPSPQPAEFLTLGPVLAYRSVTNWGLRVAQQTFSPEAQESKFLLANVSNFLKRGG